MPNRLPPGVHHPIIELALVRIREFLRQGEALFWMFGFPVLLTLALGIAFRNSGPDKILLGVENSGPAATAVFDALQRVADTKITMFSKVEGALALRTGRIALLVRPETDGSYTYRFDPTRPESRVAHLAADSALQGYRDTHSSHDEKVTEPGSRYIDFLLPGLLGMNMMGSGMWSLGFALVDMRSKHLLKRLAATPMRRWHFLLSYMLSRLVFLWLELGVVVGFAWIVFGVHVQGSYLNVAIISLLGALTFAAIGLLTAARPTTIEAVSGWMNLVMLPMWLLSGTFFSSARFPDVAQPFIKALPLTALNDALRSVMTDGAGLAASLPQLAILSVWAIVCFVLAVRIFRWQ